eukprot:g17286.t1
MSQLSSSLDASILGSTQNGDALSSGDNALSFNDSDFYLNMDDVDIGPQIGQGAFSKVYLGRYLGELVAVKKQARREADLEAYLMRELAVLKHFQHENLLQYVGASNAASAEPGGTGHVFIVTELACGGDLLALLLSDGEVGWKLRVSILTDAARALEFLHSKSLIHRDIKSPNILLDSQHRCKIADFGMARQLGANMTVVGTDAYMAPELMFDNPYGTSADMFSFGVVLWETIYRQKAGADEFMERRMCDRFELDVQTLQEEAPPDTSASLVALAAQLVESEQDQRPTAEDTLLWLEDLTDSLPDDMEEPRSPIDYESLFPLEVGEREIQRLAHVRSMSARAKRAAAGSGGGTPNSLVGPGSAFGGSGYGLGSSGYGLGGGGGGGSLSPGLPPGLPADTPALPRRVTLGVPAGRGVMGANRSSEGAGLQRTRSLQGGLKADGSAAAAAAGGGSSSGAGGAGGGSELLGSPGMMSAARRNELKRVGTNLSSASFNSGYSGTAAFSSGGGGGTGIIGSGRAIGASHAPITRQGYLYKKGKSGLKNWQKRWFVLEGSRLIWYRDSKSYPRDPRGFLELKGCFLVKGSSQRWKILSADAAAEQDDYNREIGAKTAKDMENWLKSLQEAIDGADTGEGPAGVTLPVLNSDEQELDRHLYHGTKTGYRTDMTVEAWLDSLGLGSLAEAFFAAGYQDFLVIQEMGLTDVDLAYIGVKNAAQRKALKMAAGGFVELMLHVEISGFFNYNSELVYRVDSKWRYLKASTFFEFSDFEDLHKRLKMAMKDTKFHKMMPPLPGRPNSKKMGTNDHARQMAKLQQELNGYMQRLVMLVGTKEPYFTMLCGKLDLLPPDPSRLPARDTDILSQMQTRAGGGRKGTAGGGGGIDESGHTQNGDGGRKSGGGGRGLLSATGRKSSRSSFSGKGASNSNSKGDNSSSSRPSSLRKASPSTRSGGAGSSGGGAEQASGTSYGPEDWQCDINGAHTAALLSMDTVSVFAHMDGVQEYDDHEIEDSTLYVVLLDDTGDSDVYLNADEGVGMTILPDALKIPVISCADQTYLARTYGEPMVAAHLRAADLLFEACRDAPFETRMYACSSVPELWAMIEKWFRPNTNADKHLLRRQLETVRMEEGSDPKIFLANVLSRELELKAVGVEIPDAEMVQLILRQLSDDFDVERRTIIFTDPDISRAALEQRINAAYSVRKANSLGKLSTAAAPAASNASAAKSNPHALAVGQGVGFRQGGNGGFERHPGGGNGVWGRGQPMQQQQWSRGGGTPPQREQWRSSGGHGGASQQQQWRSSGGHGGASQQQQWSRGGRTPQQQQGYWSPSSPRQQQPPQPPPWNPSSEFTAAYRDWYTAYVSWHKSWKQEQQQLQQQRSGPPAPHGSPTPLRRSAMAPPPPPPPPNYHVRPPRNSSGGYAYANVVSAPSAGRTSSPVPDAASGGFVDANGYYTPDPCGGPGPAPLCGAGGEGCEETSVGPVEQPSEPAEEERRVTFQENPVDADGGVVYEEEDPGEWNAAVEAQNRGEDPFGQHFAAALSLPYGAATAGRDGDVFHPGFMVLRLASEGPCVDEGSDGPFDRGYMALQPLSPRSASRASAAADASASASISSSSLNAMAVNFPSLRPGVMVFLGDTGAAIHGIKSGEHVYNRRPPLAAERFLQTANGECMEVLFFGDLDVNFHSDMGAGMEDRIVTLENVAVAPGLMYNLISLSQLQRQQSILLDATGAWLLGNRVHFSLLGNGNYIQGTRVRPGEPNSAPAMAAAVIRPGKQKCMNINDLHHALAHRNAATLKETAKQLGIKVTSLLEFCDFCAEAKGFKVSVPRSLAPHRVSKRPFHRIAIDLAGAFAASIGGSRYVMMILDLCTNYGWTEFLVDKSAETVAFAFKRWLTRVKTLLQRYGKIEFVLADNGNEFTNATFRRQLVEQGCTLELTSVDGPKSNGQVERRIALVMEGARAAWLGFKTLFPGIIFPPLAHSYQNVWPESVRWMSNAHNMCAEVTKQDKRSPELKLYGKRVTSLVLPFMCPGFRQDPQRDNKLASKGERCFYLSPGEDHSSGTCKIMLATGKVTFSSHVTFGFYRRPYTVGDAAWGQQEVPSSRPWGTPALVDRDVVVDDGKRDGTPVSSAGGDEDVGAKGGTVDNSGSVRAPSGAEEAEPGKGASGRGAAVPETADHEAERGGSLCPPPLPPETEWVPPLVHQSPEEELPAGARLYKGRVYRAEPRQTRAQARAANNAAATAGGASEVGIGAALVLQFPETRRTPGMFTIRRAQEDILRAVYDEPAPDISPDDLPAVPVHELAAPLTVEEALSGPYAKIWKHAMRGELGGHLDTGTFEQLRP